MSKSISQNYLLLIIRKIFHPLSDISLTRKKFHYLSRPEISVQGFAEARNPLQNQRPHYVGFSHLFQGVAARKMRGFRHIFHVPFLKEARISGNPYEIGQQPFKMSAKTPQYQKSIKNGFDRNPLYFSVLQGVC